MKKSLTLVAVCILVASFAAQPAGQVPAQPHSQAPVAKPVPKAPTAEALSAARAALDAGQVAEALEGVNVVLSQEPSNRDAVLVKLRALGPMRLDECLATYDKFVAAKKSPDVELLALLGRGDLERNVQNPTGRGILLLALERLTTDGNSQARARLQKEAAASATPQEALEANTALARTGDEEAIRRLGQLLARATMPDAQAEAMEALKAAGARSEAEKVAVLLRSSEPQIRSRAALVIGSLHYEPAVPALESMFKTDEEIVRGYVAVALKLLGRSTADEYLARLLDSPMTEARLLAGEAYRTSKTTEWVPFIRSVLTDKSELYRLKAAELLACCDEQNARAALRAGLASPVLSLRAEAADVLESTGLADASTTRTMLGDSSALVRIRGAGAAMKLARLTTR